MTHLSRRTLPIGHLSSFCTSWLKNRSRMMRLLTSCQYAPTSFATRRFGSTTTKEEPTSSPPSSSSINTTNIYSNHLDIELRENCRCEDCCLKATKQRKAMKINPNVKVLSMYEKEGVLYVTWSDGHKGFIPLADLNLTSNEVLNDVEQSLKKATKKRSSNGYSEKINPLAPSFFWDSELLGSEKANLEFEFNQVMKDTKCLLQLMEAFEKYGVVQVRNCFGNFGASELLAKRLGMIRTTIYGDTFVITNNPEVTTVESRVYTNAQILPQTDLPYYELSPDIILFHSIEKAEFGGESFFVDGFHCASLLKQHAPKHFDILSNVRVPFRKNFIEKGFDMISNHCVIECNPDTSAVERIHFDEGNRQSLNWDLPVENKKDFYDALRSFRDLIFDDKNRFEFMMERGDIAIFDNRRVLHGNKAFVGKRIVEGCYLDWQSVHGNYLSQTAKLSK